jgi:hypothetical protein
LFWESWPWSAGATAGNVLSSRVAPEPVLSASLGERRAAANKPCPGLFYRYAYMPLQSGQRSSRYDFEGCQRLDFRTSVGQWDSITRSW